MNQSNNESPTLPLLVVLSGPSGVGKDAVVTEMKRLGMPFHFTITATTRPKRPTEQAGLDYMFLTVSEFEDLIRKGDLLEWATVYGHYYGVPRSQITNALKDGKDVIIKTDVQGAETLKQLIPQGIFVFLAPPSLKDLEAHLLMRTGHSESDLKVRLQAAQSEMEHLSSFTHVVVNEEGKLDTTVAYVQTIINNEKQRPERLRVTL